MSRHHISDAYIPEAFNKHSDIESREAFKALGLSGEYSQSVSVKGKVEKCAKFSKDIVGASLIAMGKHFHQSCFTCSQCHKAIPVKIGGVTPSFATLGDDVWCEDCVNKDKQTGTAHSVFEKKGGPGKSPAKVAGAGAGAGSGAGATCKACAKALPSKYVVLKDGSKYHKECFVCANCKSDLSAGHKFHEDKAYCGNCYTKRVFTSDPYKNKIPPAHLVDDGPAPAVPVSGAGKFCGMCGQPTATAGTKF